MSFNDNPAGYLARIAASLGEASSTPVIGSLSASGESPAFTPDIARPIWVGLFGTWAGTVTLERRIGSGGNWRAVTLAGALLSWASNINEPVYEETVSGAQYRLNFARTSGTLEYEVRQ